MNMILIGMPGVGKSTVGVLLAKSLGYEFIDIDLIIQIREKELLQNIINQKGLKAFLDAEERAVLSLDARDSVIATGGSVVYREESMLHLKKLGAVVFLDQSYGTIHRRLKNISSRGIAMSGSQTLKQLYDERKELYHRYADIEVDCRGKGIEEVIKILLQIANDQK